MKISWFVLFITVFILFSYAEKQPADYTRYVDPFIGTGGSGHTYPGATVPFGMVQVSPDNGDLKEGWEYCSGYSYNDSVATGFSHTHLSGTGIGDLTDVALLPTNKPFRDDTSGLGYKQFIRPHLSKYSHNDEVASPGYYSVKLKDNGIFVELTASARTGLQRYTFPSSNQSAIVIDLAHRINQDRPTETMITSINDTLLTGYRFSDGWATNQKVFFAIRFSKAFKSVDAVLDGKILPGQTSVTGKITRRGFLRGQATRLILHFDTKERDQIMVKTSVSSVSEKGALLNLDTDISGWDFDKVRSKARDLWNKELSKIDVTVTDETKRKIFYTALYHTMLAPTLFQDKDGSYRGLDGAVHKDSTFNYYSTFSLWDTYRATHPLFNLIETKRVTDMIKSLLVMSEQGKNKWLPLWPLVESETSTMIGIPAISIIAEAYLKGIHGFDIEKAYAIMKAHALSDEYFDLGYYNKYGYIPFDKGKDQQISRTVEYSYADGCLAELAKKLGKKEDHLFFLNRSKNYRNLYDSASGGFLHAKAADGTWSPNFDPKQNRFFTEGNSWQYSFAAHHDPAGMMEMMGGQQKFIDKLDSLFSTSSFIDRRFRVSDMSGFIGQYVHGNEPSHATAYLYCYAGAQKKTQERVRQIMKTLYTDQPNGLCGNDDCGQMSAWYVFSTMGFYPVTPTSNEYALGSPLHTKSVIKMENGKTFTILSPTSSEKNIYVKSVKLNGKVLIRPFIKQSDIIKGGVLEFEMTDH